MFSRPVADNTADATEKGGIRISLPGKSIGGIAIARKSAYHLAIMHNCGTINGYSACWNIDFGMLFLNSENI